MTRTTYALALLAAAMALTIGSCGGSSDAEQTNASTAETSLPSEALSVGYPSNASFGGVIVSAVGSTLYVYGKDKQNSGVSACYGRCAEAWPPLTVSSGDVELKGVRGAQAAMVGTFKRKDGTTQVTYDGWPLYMLSGESPAQAIGVGSKAFGASWYPLHPNGELAGD